MTDLVVFEDERCIKALQTSPETYIDGSFAKNTDHQRHELEWVVSGMFIIVDW